MLQFSEKLLNNLMQIGLTVSLAALVPLNVRCGRFSRCGCSFRCS